jgi:MFS family permease
MTPPRSTAVLSSPDSTIEAPRGNLVGSARSWGRATFRSIRVRNYRLFFIGQAISLSGTWMQGVAQSLLVLKLTGSGAALGVVIALQFLPVLLLAPYGGVLADRFSKRRLLFFTQGSAAALALTLGALVATGAVRLWMLYVLALLLGAVNALDNPTRQAFVHELVGVDTLRNAVTLNSLEVNLCRVIGPALAGVLIVTVGLAPCFIINGLSYLAVLWCLWLMKGTALHRGELVVAAKGQIREGFAYVRKSPLILDVLVMMAIVGTLTYEFQVMLPLLAKFTFHRTDTIDAIQLTVLVCATGVGAVVGGLLTAGRKSASLRGLTLASLGFGVSVIAVSLAPSMIVAALLMVIVGGFSIVFTSLTNTILQIESVPTMRGRVMSLWSVAFLGSTVIGAPIIGWIGEHIDPRWSMATGGIAALVAAAVGLHALRAGRHTTVPEGEIGAPAMTEKEDGA